MNTTSDGQHCSFTVRKGVAIVAEQQGDRLWAVFLSLDSGYRMLKTGQTRRAAEAAAEEYADFLNIFLAASGGAI